MNTADITKALKSVDRKTYIIIGVVIVVIVAAVIIIRKVTKGNSDSLDGHEESLNDPNASLTYSSVQYSDFADSLEQYLSDKSIQSGGLLGVNQSGVYEVFRKMKTDNDIDQLIVSFGTRKIRKFLTFNTEEYTLPQAIAALMTSGERKKINSILNENNISYQF